MAVALVRWCLAMATRDQKGKRKVEKQVASGAWLGWLEIEGKDGTDAISTAPHPDSWWPLYVLCQQGGVYAVDELIDLVTLQPVRQVRAHEREQPVL